MDQILLDLAKGGPGYIMAAYLLWQKSKNDDAQNAANMKVATTLAMIRTLLAMRFNVSDPGKDETP
jgi:hypothetical protein